MYRNEYISKVGFTKVLDLTCSNHGGMYTSNEHSTCPKCGKALIAPTFTTKEGVVRPYCITEVTLYPQMPEDVTNQQSSRTDKAKGIMPIIRMSLWGRYNKDNNTVVPDPRTQYLVPKRLVRTLFNTPPVFTTFTTKGKVTKLEQKYVFDHRKGDQIEFLDYMDKHNTAAAPAIKEVQTADNIVISAKELDRIIAQKVGLLTAASTGDAGIDALQERPAEVNHTVIADMDVLPPSDDDYPYDESYDAFDN